MSLAGTQPAVAGEAYYQLGEVRRRRGDVDGAFAAYARAHELGVTPQPGAALLRCALGDVDTARAEVRAAIAVADSGELPRLLRGAVQIALAGGDLDEAEHYLRELESADTADNVLRGAVLVRRGRYREGLTVLRAALREQRSRESEQVTAQLHQWINEAHRGLGTAPPGR
jgi:tetratricopeptide (TPR) repeat protein